MFKKLRAHSEIKWSEIVRRIIKRQIELLDSMDKKAGNETLLVMLAWQDILKKDWDNKWDERWNNV